MSLNNIFKSGLLSAAFIFYAVNTQAQSSGDDLLLDIYSVPALPYSQETDEDIINITSPTITRQKIFVDLSGLSDKGIAATYSRLLKKNIEWSGVFDPGDSRKADFVLAVYEGFFSDRNVDFKTQAGAIVLSDKLTYHSGNSQKRSYTVKIYDIKSEQITDTDIYASSLTGGAWYPDDSKIAVTVSESGNSDIYLLDAKTGQKLRKLTTQSSIETSASISPTGDIILASDQSGSPQIYRYASNGLLKRLTFASKYNTEPRWSPKGKYFLYSTIIGGSMEVMLYNNDTAEIQRVTRGGEFSEQPGFSPDGRQIIFSKRYGSNSKIHMMNMDGSVVRRLTYSDSLVIEADPDWSAFPITRCKTSQEATEQSQRQRVLEERIIALEGDKINSTQKNDSDRNANIATKADVTRLQNNIGVLNGEVKKQREDHIYTVNQMELNAKTISDLTAKNELLEKRVGLMEIELEKLKKQSGTVAEGGVSRAGGICRSGSG
ncbi:hypothetical protein CHS0354_035344 [Potamilus streckersoni]|uniref:Uncharacterized protein n=1 Tax=Potamilus streckersoni TaxID=2493646 RepID=A0AAE0VN08_9BIVA|nr:hypothetical protein CHS0354_035344 [Potamilus streckersoni]